jgi:sortase A
LKNSTEAQVQKRDNNIKELSRKMKQNFWTKCLAVALLIIGLGLVFNQQIADFLVKEMTRSSLTQKNSYSYSKKRVILTLKKLSRLAVQLLLKKV